MFQAEIRTHIWSQ